VSVEDRIKDINWRKRVIGRAAVEVADFWAERLEQAYREGYEAARADMEVSE